MNIQTYHSSSRGNLYQVDDLLIDPGVSIKEIKKCLNFKLSDISGCLCTHEHLDHVKAAKDLMKAGIDIWASRDTSDVADLSGHRLNLIEPMVQFRIGSWQILPFETIHHDKEGKRLDSVGFLLSSGASDRTKLLFVTDSQYVPCRFKGLTHIMIECNYSMEILKANVSNGLNPEAAKITIRNHMSLQTAKGFFRANDMSKVREIHLLHLSDGNSDAEMFKSEIMKLTGRPTYIGG